MSLKSAVSISLHNFKTPNKDLIVAIIPWAYAYIPEIVKL